MDSLLFPPKDSHMPYPYYTCLLLGSTGTGKTQSIVKLLLYLQKYKYKNKEGETVPQRIFIVSPTADSNPIYNVLKNLDPDDIHTNYTDQVLVEILADIKAVREEAELYQLHNRLYKRWQKSQNELDFTKEEMIILTLMNFDAPRKPKWPVNPVNHLILDDLIGTPAFKTQGANIINNLSVKCRHLGVNMYILAQTSSQVPRIIRTQARLIMMYRFNSDKITKDLYEIVSSIITPEEFEYIYDECTKEKYNFLTIDNTGKDLVLKQNLNYLIKLKRDNKLVKPDNKKSII
jgi:hypothetical protein